MFGIWLQLQILGILSPQTPLLQWHVRILWGNRPNKNQWKPRASTCRTQIGNTEIRAT
ncbi:uncharacterized protein CANTADRAFT_26602 [Suhomyces tanzawaensis NRRL Y-17324]|uniref:Uncharacterized protein n=1 Tax=Suhomyces tanzawaensis NRRL Y-17324 TaxID=984487 RepID=A0A1E4SGF3_9ASCO|nr:uncharacterized protein CANTADRAFT_26602 [Suhomyces tanzawaensis NRRL Y-17324]ODV78550.1 hypothetical protein CANTADRAFT_26602 [Suhomyces tanzawaensis NRRL Y-17324]